VATITERLPAAPDRQPVPEQGERADRRPVKGKGERAGKAKSPPTLETLFDQPIGLGTTGRTPATPSPEWTPSVTTEHHTPATPQRVLGDSRGERRIVALIGSSVLALALTGMYVSFRTVYTYVLPYFHGTAWAVPSGVDLAILVFSAADLMLMYWDIPMPGLRMVPWAFTAATIALNWQSGGPLPIRIAHAAMPSLWVIFCEYARHVIRHRVGLVAGTRMEKIRKSRWLLAPFSTARMWRRMVLWEITNYRSGLDMEADRLTRQALLEIEYGRRWRRKAPATKLLPLKLGALAPADTLSELTRTGLLDLDFGALGGPERTRAVNAAQEAAAAALDPPPAPAPAQLTGPSHRQASHQESQPGSQPDQRRNPANQLNQTHRHAAPPAAISPPPQQQPSVMQQAPAPAPVPTPAPAQAQTQAHLAQEQIPDLQEQLNGYNGYANYNGFDAHPQAAAPPPARQAPPQPPRADPPRYDLALRFAAPPAQEEPDHDEPEPPEDDYDDEFIPVAEPAVEPAVVIGKQRQQFEDELDRMILEGDYRIMSSDLRDSTAAAWEAASTLDLALATERAFRYGAEYRERRLSKGMTMELADAMGIEWNEP
jgi:hypothetical protein